MFTQKSVSENKKHYLHYYIVSLSAFLLFNKRNQREIATQLEVLYVKSYSLMLVSQNISSNTHNTLLFASTSPGKS
jgi:hypothetical protein